MSKSVQMSIKMESDLHERFMSAAANLHTPAAQLIRHLMRRFISDAETPNATTIEAMQAADRGEGKRFKSANDLFEDLGI